MEKQAITSRFDIGRGTWLPLEFGWSGPSSMSRVLMHRQGPPRRWLQMETEQNTNPLAAQGLSADAASKRGGMLSSSRWFQCIWWPLVEWVRPHLCLSVSLEGLTYTYQACAVLGTPVLDLYQVSKGLQLHFHSISQTPTPEIAHKDVWGVCPQGPALVYILIV